MPVDPAPKTDDLVERLRGVAKFGGNLLGGLWTEAANRIEALEAKVEAEYFEGFTHGWSTGREIGLSTKGDQARPDAQTPAEGGTRDG